ncbi:hypothetical protein QP185_22400 [Sphingomonas aerolata]|uniref:hypothetical protein n=1 Tax=Sphingomonas aerolata TaxID=185951 RepID=UPI002FE294F5
MRKVLINIDSFQYLAVGISDYEAMRFNVLPCQDCCGPQPLQRAAGLFLGQRPDQEVHFLLIF